MVKETHKIMGDSTILVSPTTARVPVRVGHSEAINIEFHSAITPEQAREALRKAPGVVVLDDPASGKVPLPLDCVDRDEVFVGRIRRDPTVPHGLNLWVVADNLRKGAATNAVQIAEVLVQRGWLPRRI
jgi:aspartate-semialdehyde dehydrogenase